MELKQFESFKEFVTASVGVIRAACRKEGLVYIGLSGGTTPGPVYSAMAEEKNIPFERIEFFLVDERYVPFDDKTSNYRVTAENLLYAIKGKSHGFHFFDTTFLVHKALDTYEAQLKQIPNHQCDLVILGMGQDGHVASLYPYQPALTSERLVAHTTGGRYKVKDKLTMTFTMIMKSKKILLLIAGPEKKAALDELLQSDKTVDELPAKKLLEHPNLAIHYSLEEGPEM